MIFQCKILKSLSLKFKIWRFLKFLFSFQTNNLKFSKFSVFKLNFLKFSICSEFSLNYFTNFVTRLDIYKEGNENQDLNQR